MLFILKIKFWNCSLALSKEMLWISVVMAYTLRAVLGLRYKMCNVTISVCFRCLLPFCQPICWQANCQAVNSESERSFSLILGVSSELFPSAATLFSSLDRSYMNGLINLKVRKNIFFLILLFFYGTLNLFSNNVLMMPPCQIKFLCLPRKL